MRWGKVLASAGVLLANTALADPILPVLDAARLPNASEATRQGYRQFLNGNLERAFALASNGSYGSGWGRKTIDEARKAALENCAKNGGADCRLYAEDLGVIWPGREAPPPPPPPGPLIEGQGYAFAPDARFIWHGPEAARGVIVWGHGYGIDSRNPDERGQQPPSFLRALNNAGYDIVRFDRAPEWDGNIPRVVGWLHDGLVELRRRGWKQIVAGGHSRGGINVLNLLKSPGLADVIIADAAANSGTDAGNQATRGEVYFYNMLNDVPKQTTRVLYNQFQDDPFGGNMEKRADRMRELVGPNVAALLLIDRPDGYHGHYAGYTSEFGQRFGNCIAHFVMDPTPPRDCAAGR